MPSLRRRGFSLSSVYHDPPPLSDRRLEQINSSLGHLQRIDVCHLWGGNLARLLRTPVTARWQELGHIDVSDSTGELLLRLPSLTKLHLTVAPDSPHVQFLSKLPLLSRCLSTSRHPTHQGHSSSSLPLLWWIRWSLALSSRSESSRWLQLCPNQHCAGSSCESPKAGTLGQAVAVLRHWSCHPYAGESVSRPSGIASALGLSICTRCNDCTPSPFGSLLSRWTRSLTTLSPPTALLPLLSTFDFFSSAGDPCISRKRQGRSFDWLQR